ncbi:hypothetical protein JK217_11045 [Gluconobacter kondonii]|uniref:hypothetical protein n=1 Tax=Gluconobacter kondonii TaxID=941463 RepID=UPI001B8AB706|nr:hypothetical protein [Gluconobacter kondonii]MBS1078276.1 hypothetical protein [Gluconobacter kondonii]
MAIFSCQSGKTTMFSAVVFLGNGLRKSLDLRKSGWVMLWSLDGMITPLQRL